MKILRKSGFAILVALMLFNFTAFASVSHTSRSSLQEINTVDGYYVYLYAHAGGYFYISKIVFISGTSQFDNRYIEQRETLKKRLINKVKSHSDKNILMTDVYVVRQLSYQDREGLEKQRLDEISRQKERGHETVQVSL